MRPILLSLSAFSLSAAAAAGSSATASDEEAALIDLGALAVPIVDHGHVRGTLAFKLVAEAGDASAGERMRAALPILRAAAVQAGGDYARLYASPTEPVDTERLSRALLSALQKSQSDLKQVLVVESRSTPA